jgi:hypothetical protein
MHPIYCYPKIIFPIPIPVSNPSPALNHSHSPILSSSTYSSINYAPNQSVLAFVKLIISIYFLPNAVLIYYHSLKKASVFVIISHYLHISP